MCSLMRPQMSSGYESSPGPRTMAKVRVPVSAAAPSVVNAAGILAGSLAELSTSQGTNGPLSSKCPNVSKCQM